MADEPSGVAAASKEWVDHVSASLQRQMDLALQARAHVDPASFDAPQLVRHLTDVSMQLAADSMKGVGLLMQIAKAIAEESPTRAAGS